MRDKINVVAVEDSKRRGPLLAKATETKFGLIVIIKKNGAYLPRLITTREATSVACTAVPIFILIGHPVTAMDMLQGALSVMAGRLRCARLTLTALRVRADQRLIQI